MGEPTEAIRPKWEWGLTEHTFRSLNATRIVEVKHGWEFTSADTSRQWFTVTMAKGDQTNADPTTRIPQEKWSAFFELFEFKPDHAGLFRLTHRGEQARKRLEEIAAFEKKSTRDRAEFERLKKKFGQS